MSKNVGVNITTQQRKMNQQDTCLITLVTCLRGKDKRTSKNLEVFFIPVQKPSVNEQVKLNVLHLFRNGIT